MYKLLIADDEGIVIEALTYIIANAFPDRCEVTSAKTGRTLIELAEQFRPDICLVDINMPGINGIQAMRQIREQHPQMIFIIVSAFNEFDYAKDAISLGVLAYVNKPIERGEIVEVLEQAFERVDARKERRKKELQTQEKLEIVTPIIESGFLYQMTNAYGAEEMLLSYRTLLGIEEESGNLMILRFGDKGAHGELTNEIGVSVRLEHSAAKIKRLIAGHFRGITGPMTGNTIATFLPCDVAEEDEEALQAHREEQILAAKKLSEELKRAFQVRTRIAFGNVCELTNAYSSYREALEAFTHSDEAVVYARKSRAAKDVIETAKALIDAGFSRDLSLEDVASAAGVSPHYLSKLFKKRTGDGFVEYLTSVRMQNAKKLLKQGGMTVKEIGARVGYPDQNYFSRLFKKQTGVTPTEYMEGQEAKE